MKKKLSQKQVSVQSLSLTPSLIQQMKLSAYTQPQMNLFLLEEAENNPYLKVRIKTPWSNHSSSLSRSSAAIPIDSLSQPQNESWVSDLEEELLFLGLSASQKWIATVILSAILPTGMMTIDLKEVAHYTGHQLSEVQDIFALLQKSAPFLQEKMENPINGWFLKTFPDHKDYSIAQDAWDQIVTLSQTHDSSPREVFSKVKTVLYEKYSSEHKKIDHILQTIIDYGEQIMRLQHLYDSGEQEATVTIQPDCHIYVREGVLEVLFDQSVILTLDQNTPSDASLDKKKYHEAVSLLHQVELRQSFLEQCIRILVLYQKGFFLSNKKLEAFQQKDLASLMDVHPSTISRVVNNKYFLFNGEVFPWSKLFSRSFRSKHKMLSVEYIKQEIKHILELTKDIRLTDKMIQQILIHKGISISRRTVNKYRNEILAS